MDPGVATPLQSTSVHTSAESFSKVGLTAVSTIQFCLLECQNQLQVPFLAEGTSKRLE